MLRSRYQHRTVFLNRPAEMTTSENPYHAHTPTGDEPATGAETTRPPATARDDAWHVVCGVAMGAADAVPGVSGGTVALILNVYQRLVSAITRVNGRLLQLVLRRDVRGVANHMDLRFVIPLGFGIASGLVTLGSIMHTLLEDYELRTYAVFSGLILASALIVARRIRKWSIPLIVSVLAGGGFAWWLSGLAALQNPPTGKWYIFLSGVIGICAMILPGISGAFILTFLGVYKYVTGLLKDLVHMDFTVDKLLTVFVFCLGCLTGLLSFSRVLKWLLARYHDVTMAVLCGFMLGSLRKLWPFRSQPDGVNNETVLILTLLVVATAAVLLLDLWGRLRKTEHAAS